MQDFAAVERWSHHFDPSILRENDIRGVFNRTLTTDDAYAVGRAMATMVDDGRGRRTVHVCRDDRMSSEELEAAVVDGLLDGGVDVVRLGLGPTPLLYYAVFSQESDGGIMITGSHSPPEYNGFKIMIGKRILYGDGIQRLGRIAAGGCFIDGSGGESWADLVDSYVERLAGDYHGGDDLKVAWDTGGGAAGPAVAALTRRLPGQHLLIDEPGEECLDRLSRIVLAEGCDLGIVLRGDGNRITVVDDGGRVLSGDRLLALLARDVLARRPGATVIADVTAGRILFDEIERLGGRGLMWRTGHSLIQAKMLEVDAPLAGERSGHIFFAEGYYGCDDALYAGVRLLNVVGAAGRSVTALCDDLPSTLNTAELHIPCPDARKFQVIEEVRERLARDGHRKIVEVDGVRVIDRDGWWLLRASNTRDALVGRCEASDDAALGRLKDQLAAQVRQSGIPLAAS